MELYYFNVSGFKFILDDDRLDQYPENLFTLIGTTKIPTIKDKEGSYFINRNPKFAEHIYGSIVHDFSINYLMDVIFPNYDVFELEQLSNEFKYYGIPSLFMGKCVIHNSSIIDSFGCFYTYRATIFIGNYRISFNADLSKKESHCVMNKYGNKSNEYFPSLPAKSLKIKTNEKSDIIFDINYEDYNKKDQKNLQLVKDIAMLNYSDSRLKTCLEINL